MTQKFSRYLTLTILLIFATSIGAKEKRPLPLTPTQAQCDSVLSILDKVMENRGQYQKMLCSKADSAILASSKQRGEKRQQSLQYAYRLYSHYNGKKAFEVLDLMEKYNDVPDLESHKQWIKDDRAYVYSVMGMFHRSFNLIQDSHIENYPRNVRMHHYDIVYRVLQWIDFTYPEEALTPLEMKILKTYGDSLATQINDTVSRAFFKADNYLSDRNYMDAEEEMVKIWPITEGKNETYTYAHMADIYVANGNKYGAIYYLALTSIDDIMSGVTEYMCLPKLVSLLFKDGDIDRANRYMQCCFDDSKVFPSQMLKNQTAEMYRDIEKAYRAERDANYRNTNRFVISLLILAFFTVIIMGLIGFLRHRHRMNDQLKTANTKLENSNSQLEDINKRLEDNNGKLVTMNGKLEQALKIHSQFMNNVTHELHTPMNAIYGFTQLLEAEEDTLDDEHRFIYEQISISSRYLQQLIDNIIIISDYGNSGTQINLVEVKISHLLEMIELEIFNPKKDIVEIKYDIQVSGDFKLMASYDCIKKLILNLVANSLKVTDEGSVTIGMALSDDGRMLRLTVADTGPGMEDVISRNGPFSMPTAETEFSGGIKYSLAACRLLAEIQGGTIHLAKNDETGVTIEADIPVIQ